MSRWLTLIAAVLFLSTGCGAALMIAGGKAREAEKADEDVCKPDPDAPLCSVDRDCNDTDMACKDNLCVPWQCA